MHHGERREISELHLYGDWPSWWRSFYESLFMISLGSTKQEVAAMQSVLMTTQSGLGGGLYFRHRYIQSLLLLTAAFIFH
jgi:hypothetical protein